MLRPEEAKTVAAQLQEAKGEPVVAAAPLSAGQALESLLNHISRSEGFPAFLANVQEILSFQNNPYFSIQDIARVILRDLAMTTQILKLVNSIYFQTYQRQVQTVSGAVMLLGLEHVRDLVMGLKFFENFRQPGALLVVKKLVLVSFLTAIQSQELVWKEHHLKNEEVFLTALLYDLGELIAAYYFPEKYQQMLKLAEAQGLSRSGAAKEILHVSLEELSLATLKLWNFPTTLVNRIKAVKFGGEGATGPERRLKKIIDGANSLSRSLLKEDLTQEEWQRQRAKFCQNLGVKPDFLEESLAASLERFQELAQTLRINLKELGFSAKVTIIEDEGTGTSVNSAGKKPRRIDVKAKPAAAMASPETEGEEVQKLKFLYQILEEIHQAMAEKAAVNQILSLVMEGLYRGLGFDRVAFCLVTSDRTCLQSRYGLGEKVEKLLPLLNTPLSARKNALALALTQRREYLLNPYNQPADYLLMDEGFWQLSGAQILLASPIHVDHAPIGLLYVDRCKPKALITELERQRLRSFRDLIILSIRLNSRTLNPENG